MKKHFLSKVYNLLDQDFNQRNIAPLQNASAFQATSTDNFTAFANANYNQKISRPICSHCGYNRHKIDKCYKIDGYPPSFKHKKPFQSEKIGSIVKSVVGQLDISDFRRVDNNSDILNYLSHDQIQGVIEYFNAQLQPSKSAFASMSNGTITTLYGMISSYAIDFIGILRANAMSLRPHHGL